MKFKLKEIEGLIPERKEVGFSGDNGLVGYNRGLEVTEEREIEMDENEMAVIVKEALNKEAVRNMNPAGHGFSKLCSCGRCHDAFIVTRAFTQAMPRILKGVK